MTYKDTVDWMFSQLPMYQNQGKSAYKKDLSNIILLAQHLKNPERDFKTIHVAGTNGKGSTSHMLASIFQEAGYKVGLYTSPHLKDFRERIKINGKEISKQFVTKFIKTYRSFFETNSLSFFEMTVGMAFNYFSKQEVDIAIIEVGLGGRLDSTNIITPEISVITNIGLDHTEFLGYTLVSIAKEKAGIIKKNTPIIIGESHLETKPIFDEIASKKKAEIFYANENIRSVLKSDLLGIYQKKNIKTVMQSIRVLQAQGWSITDKSMTDGLLKVVQNTGLIGRWQVLRKTPVVICDTAHNQEGLTFVMQQLQNENYKQLHIVFGTVKDKNLDALVGILPKSAIFYYCKPSIPRGKPEIELAEYFQSKGYIGTHYHSVNSAYKDALNNANLNDLIFIGGSTFVVAEII